jgi:hypothetical protein
VYVIVESVLLQENIICLNELLFLGVGYVQLNWFLYNLIDPLIALWGMYSMQEAIV